MSDVERMSAAEIRRNYNEAKDKPKQISILADLNDCKRSDIKKIIDGETDELPPLKTENKKYTPPKKQRSGIKLLDEEQKTIIEMHLNGRSDVDIANAVKRSIITVKKYIAKYVSENPNEKEAENVLFAEEQTEQEREQLAAEIEEMLQEATIEAIPREAPARVEELIAMEAKQRTCFLKALLRWT